MADRASNKSANGSAAALGKNTPSTSNGTSQKDMPTRHSPIAPLAPLEYLQNQRRGSITDPSLHAASMNSNSKLNTNYRQQPEPTSASSGSTHNESSLKSHTSDPRPASPYVFGDATSHSTDSNSQIRKLLRSPSNDHPHKRPASALSHGESRVPDDRNNQGGQGMLR